jgi:hypothetical protein
MVRFATGAGAVLFAARIAAGCASFRALAHRALCARAIFRREAADIIRVGADMILVGWLACRDVPAPFNDSIAEIAVSNFSTCDCASRRSARSCWSALARFPIFPPRI